MIKAKSALLALVAVLVICLLVGCVVDGGENNNNGPSVGLAYTSNSDGSCYVSGIGSCTDKQIKIPATSPDGDTVIGIGESAFEGCMDITSVTIPDGVTSIGSRAFTDCMSLEEISIPEGLVSIGEYAFAQCLSVREISLPQSVESIGSSAFINCSGLESVNLPEGITVISEACFTNCYNLVSITIPSSVTQISKFAFMSCVSLVEVCNKSNLDIEDKYYSTSYVTTRALGVISDESESKLKKNGDYVFYDDGEQLLLVKYLGREREITLPNCDGRADYKIHRFAFSQNPYITKVTIPEGVKGILYSAFELCMSLTSVEIPSSVSEIDPGAFFNCYSLIEVCNKSSVDVDVDAHVISDESESGIRMSGDYVFYEDGDDVLLVKYLGREAEIRLPEYNGGKEYEVYQWAFVNPIFNHRARSMRRVEIPDFVTAIGTYAFSECNSLEEILIGDGVSSIKSAFTGCMSVQRITLGKKVSDADIDFLSDCKYLTDIAVVPENITYKSVDGNLYSKDGKTLVKYAIGKADNSFVVPNGVNVIGKKAFQGANNLTEIVISEGVTAIRERAFYNCNHFTKVVIPKSMSEIGKDAFTGLGLEGPDGTVVYKVYYAGTEDEWKSLRGKNKQAGLPYMANYNYVYEN